MHCVTCVNTQVALFAGPLGDLVSAHFSGKDNAQDISPGTQKNFVLINSYNALEWEVNHIFIVQQQQHQKQYFPAPFYMCTLTDII